VIYPHQHSPFCIVFIFLDQHDFLSALVAVLLLFQADVFPYTHHRSNYTEIFAHGQRLMQEQAQPSSPSGPGTHPLTGRGLRMVWKSCTHRSPFFDEISPLVVRFFRACSSLALITNRRTHKLTPC
jgi:hypothetical protein